MKHLQRFIKQNPHCKLGIPDVSCYKPGYSFWQHLKEPFLLKTMKKTYENPLLLIILMLLPLFTKAQLTWQNPLPQGNTLTAVHFVNSNVGTAVGKFGTIMHTTDGGNTWTVQESGTTRDFNGVYFSDVNHGTIVGNCTISGENGIILRTTDGGNTWIEQQSGIHQHLYGVAFSDNNNGLVVGNFGAVLKTTDGGTTWTQKTSGIISGLNSVVILNLNTAIAVGAVGKIIKTLDGGETWTTMTSNTTKYLRSIYFSNSTTGCAVGDGGVIIRTTNSGSNWTIVASNTTQNLNGISFFNENIGVIVSGNTTSGTGGLMLKTINGGSTWSQISGTSSTAGGTLYCISAINAFGYAVGNGGKIVRSNDSGATWNIISSGTTQWLRNICFIDSLHGTVVGANGTILQTSNGGQTWESRNSGVTDVLYDVTFSDINNGIIVGSGGKILKTIDGGANWIISYTAPNAPVFLGVAFNQNGVGIAVGPTDFLLRTSDWGATWNEIDLSPNGLVNDIQFIDLNTVVAVGNGFSLRSTDAGLTWTPKGIGGYNMNGVYFLNSLNGIAVGNEIFNPYGQNGVIFRTNDGGVSWTNEFVGYDQLEEISFSDSLHGAAVGWNGTILFTMDGGNNWIRQVPINNNHMWGVKMMNSSKMIAVGRNGNIIAGSFNNIATRILNLSNVYLEGFYLGGGLMSQLKNPEDSLTPYFTYWGNTVDLVRVELHDANNYSIIAYSTETSGGSLSEVLKTDGTIKAFIPGQYSGSYYLTIRHRNSLGNHLAITTAQPVSFSENIISYSFDTQAKVYQGNVKLLPDGSVVLYAGDVNQDGYIDLLDRSSVENNIFNQIEIYGYSACDLNGDAIFNQSDLNLIENNNTLQVTEKHP